MKNIRRAVVIATLASVLVGCPGVVPGSRLYAPNDDAEKQIFGQARRDVFPSDIRANPDNYKGTTVFWSSIIRTVDTTTPNQTVVTFEHHYWDFIEDYSIQKAIAFLSPRGEGAFQVVFPTAMNLKTDDMGLVYGTLDHITADGTIVLKPRGLRTLQRELYATDVWDYGRDFLLKGDKKDFKVLRVPMK